MNQHNNQTTAQEALNAMEDRVRMTSAPVGQKFRMGSLVEVGLGNYAQVKYSQAHAMVGGSLNEYCILSREHAGSWKLNAWVSESSLKPILDTTIIDKLWKELNVINGVKEDTLIVKDSVNHPAHYNTGKIEVIEFIEDQKLDYHCGQVIKYVARAGKKYADKEVEDLEKAAWYLKRKVEILKATKEKRVTIRPNDMFSDAESRN